MIPVTTSVTQLQRLPARDERIDQAGLQLEQNIQEVQERLFQVAFEVGLKMGEATQSLRLERLQLESENRSLENDITQLKAVHISELNVAVDGLIAKRNILAEKVKGVVEMLEVFCKTYPKSAFPSTDVLSFTLLLDNISQVNYEGLRRYPEYHDYRKNRVISPEQTAIVPLADALVLRQTHPIVRSLTEKAMEEYETRLAETTPIRAANLALIDKKEVMIDYHGKYLEEMNRQEREFRLKKTLETVRSMYDRIKWELPTLPPTQTWFPGAFGGLIPAQYIPIPQSHPAGCQEKLKEIQEAVKGVISTLETFVNPQRIEGII